MSSDKVSLAEQNVASAVERIERAAAAQAQLSFLSPVRGDASADGDDGPRGPGRPKGSRNRSNSELRRWLAAQGYRTPEQQLAQIGMLDVREDVFMALMARAEQVIAWASDNGGGKADRLDVFFRLLGHARSATEAMMPYGLSKVTPDAVVNQSVSIVMPSPLPVRGGDQARDVTVDARRMAPPPMPGEVERNQGVSAADRGVLDGEGSDE